MKMILRKRSRRKSRRKSIINNLKPSKRSGDCVSRSKTQLKNWQKKVVKHMDKNDSLLVVHSTGLGKTLTAVAVSECFLDKNPLNRVIFVGPPGLISNFIKQLTEKYGADEYDRYTFYSFDKFFREEKKHSPIICDKNTLLIVDEAHNLRNPKSIINKTTKNEKLTRVNSILHCAMNASKRLLLSATPLVNSIEDFIPLINMLYGRRKVGTYSQVKNGIAESQINIPTLKKLLKDKIDIVSISEDNDKFPKKFIYHVTLPMSNAYFKRYKHTIEAEIDEEETDKLFTSPKTFYNGHRRAVNNAGKEYFSTKIEKMIPIIKDEKAVIYTNWLEFGIQPIEETLEKLKISFETITGSTTKKRRQEIVDSFNNNDFQILVITRAGSEGLDLHEVRNMVVLDPVWNYAGLEQIIGRVARYESHSRLPKSQRNVNIYLLISTEPEIVEWESKKGEEIVSGDRILYNIIAKKKVLTENLMKILKDYCSI